MSEPRQSWRAFLEATQCCILEPKCLRCLAEDKAADRIEELETGLWEIIGPRWVAARGVDQAIAIITEALDE